MTVICEECGKVYHIDPNKLERYKGKTIRARCGECGHVTPLSSLMAQTEESSEDFVEPFDSAMADEVVSTPIAESMPEIPEERTSKRKGSTGDSKRGWIGLRGKMFFLFLVIPIALMASSGVFSQIQLNELVDDITDRSTALVARAGEEQLLQKARDVALQCEIYLQAHPELSKEDFAYDPQFTQVAVQQVGKTGYTCLVEEPMEAGGEDWTIWAHPNPNLVGVGDVDLVRKAIGVYFDEFLKVLVGSAGGKESTGQYMWKDPDGKVRAKYMAVSPIQIEGVKYQILSTAYMDEYTEKTDSLRVDAREMATRTRNINFGFLIAAIFIIGLGIIVYGYRLTRNIRYLTEAADRISVGDLEAEIEVKSKDEIGSLADAISRMQDSLRFSIERLRRRR